MSKLKILFIQNFFVESLAYQSLSYILKKNGYIVDIAFFNNKDIKAKIIKFKPNFVGITLSITQITWAKTIISQIKKIDKNIKIICGGPLITAKPDIIKYIKCDYIVVGEGEIAILDLLKNKYINKNGIYNKNFDFSKKIEFSQLICSFNYDIMLYYKYKIFRNKPVKIFSIHRGCSGKCSFCSNSYIIKNYKKKYLRVIKLNTAIKQLKIIKKMKNTKLIKFIDPNFLQNPIYMKNFLKRYKKEINLPFYCYIRADFATENNIKLLKKSGCILVDIGVECSKDSYRYNILNKTIKNSQIFNAIKLLKKYKIKFITTNMLNLPEQSFKDMINLYDLNLKLKPNSVFTLLYQPIPNTELEKLSIKKGYIDKNYLLYLEKKEYLLKRSILKNKNRIKIERLHKLFNIFIILRIEKKILLKLINYNLDFIYNILYNISLVYTYFLHNRFNLIEMLKEIYYMAKIYL